MTQLGTGANDAYPISIPIADLIAFCSVPATKAAPGKAAAKVKSGLACNLSVREGVQMHGGIGMTDEYDIGLYMKRDRALAEFFGDTHFHADRVARMNGY